MPTPQQVHVDRYLTNMAIKYTQEQDVFVAGSVFPIVPVLKKSDKYIKFPKSYFLRDEMEPRPLGGRPRATGYELESGNYNCEEEDLEHKIDDRTRENADEPIMPDLRGQELLTEKALIHRERLWAEHFFKKEVWATEYVGVAKESEEKAEEKVTKFSNYKEGEPIKFIDTVATTMRRKTGRRPNRLVLGAEVYNALKNHPAMLERIKYTEKAVITTDLLASLFGIEQVLVAEGIYNKAPEGKAEETEFAIDPKSALLCYATPSPSLQTPSAGYTFAWTGLLAGVGNALAGVIIRGREELAHTDVLQIRTAYDMRATASDLGVFLREVA